MKTKIIYISGNEVFDMADIRAAFEEVRVALNLDKKTVLFGVPVDEDDAGLMDNKQNENIIETTSPIIEQEILETKPNESIAQIDEETPIDDMSLQNQDDNIVEDNVEEIVAVEKPKKRGRPRKETIAEDVPEQVIENENNDPNETSEEKIVPILSVLSTNDDENEASDNVSEEIDIIPEISDTTLPSVEIPQTDDIPLDEDEADLEKLLSAMTPLAEDISEKPVEPDVEQIDETEDISVDATLEQLATEFAETQDKIATENKSTSRSKIGKLRNILPFKQSKHKDQGLGDLFGWAGIAANDEDFSVPGFFTNAASKK